MKNKVFFFLLSIVLSIFILSCAEAIPPQSLIHLRSIVSEKNNFNEEQFKNEKWLLALDYLKSSNDAITNGTVEQAKRFAILGLIQAKLAKVSRDLAQSINRLEETEKEAKQLDLEILKVEVQIDKEEQEEARGRLRLHLENVVDESRRQAAYEEELLEQNLNLSDNTIVDNARRQVAREMISVAKLDFLIANIMVDCAIIIKERLVSLQGAIDLVNQVFLQLDLAQVQQHVETAHIEFNHLQNDVWYGVDKNAVDENFKLFTQKLKDNGLKITTERVGVSIVISMRGNKIDKKSKKTIEKIAFVLKEFSNIKAVLMATRGGFANFAVSQKKSKSAAISMKKEFEKEFEKQLIKQEMPQNSIYVFNCGATRPINALYGNKNKGAILLFPLPVTNNEN